MLHDRAGTVAVLVGAPGREGDEFVVELTTLAAELGIDDRVIFAGRRTDLADTLAFADVVVEIIDDGVTGLPVEPGDATALGDGIGDLLDDRDRSVELGLRSQSTVVERFGVARHARAVEAVYDRALSGR